MFKIKVKRKLIFFFFNNFRYKFEDCIVTVLELLMVEVFFGVILFFRVGGGIDFCFSFWGRLLMDELERGELGIKFFDSNREVRL